MNPAIELEQWLNFDSKATDNVTLSIMDATHPVDSTSHSWDYDSLTDAAEARYTHLCDRLDLDRRFLPLVRECIPAWLVTWAEFEAVRVARESIDAEMMWEIGTGVSVSKSGIWQKILGAINDSEYGQALIAAIRSQEQS